MRVLPLLLLPLLTMAVEKKAYGVAIIYPDRASKYYSPMATEGVTAFEKHETNPINVVLLKKMLTTLSMCRALRGTVHAILEKSPTVHVFIVPPEIKESYCYQQWGDFFTSRVLFVTPDPSYPDEPERKAFWLMSGELYRSISWAEMADYLAEMYDFEGVAASSDSDYTPASKAKKFSETTPRPTSRLPSTQSIYEIDTKRVENHMEDQKRRRRLSMLLIGCGAVCIMASAFYIRNRFCGPTETAERNDDKMEATETEAKTAKYWTAEEK